MYGLTQEELGTIKTVLRMLDVSKAVLFGSRAKGSHKKGSDVDLAIIGDERKVSYYLNEETNLPYYFDIVNLYKITNQNLIEHIQRVGKEIVGVS
ncbi:MAG: nucleotidyltransferase domain-containing protein [Campylobacterales bacterium]|nr:nucleotidyltransferase domain-containing protein [Campylobacterales bacterium]